MVYATEMAKTLGKQPSDWTRTKQAKAFLRTLSSVAGIPATELIVVRQGINNEQGTWMHKDVAIEFARWLSPDFATWWNDRIMELMRHGVTATPSTLEDYFSR